MQATTAAQLSGQAPQQQQQQLPQAITEIDTDLHLKMAKVGIIKSGAKARGSTDKKSHVDYEGSQLFESGVALAKYIISIKETLSKRGIADLEKVDAQRLFGLKQATGPQTKMFNWNIIAHELDKIGVKTEANARIVAGDQEAILQLFKKVDQKVSKITGQANLELDENSLAGYTINEAATLGRRASVGRIKKRVAREGVDILTMRTDKETEETESSLELILNLLCKSFAMKPKQAAALLTNNNQFLIHSIVKGVKGNYEPLNNWYTELKQNMKHLIYLLEIETEQLPKLLNIPKVLGTLASGLFSQNLDICRHSFEMLNTMNQEFSSNKLMFKQAHDWVVDKEGGLEYTLQALKRHPDLAGEFINFVTRFSSIMNQPIDRVYKDEFRKLFQEPHEYISVINDIFPYIVKHQYKEVLESGILDFWIDLSLEQAGLDSQKTADEKIAAQTLLTEMWLAYTEHIDKKTDRIAFIQQVLKKSGRDRQRNLRLISIALMFRLLDKFAADKNPSAPSLYKALIFSLIENPSDILLREHYFQNFTYLFENQTSIPLNLLLDPLVKQITISENVTYFYKVFDFDFFTMIAKHPKLTPANAVSLADLLAKIYLNDVALASAACIPLMLLCSRFNLDEAMQEFIVKFETVCLAGLMNLERNAEELQKAHQQTLQEREKALRNAQESIKKGQTLAITEAPPQEFQHKHGKPTKRMTKEEQARILKEQDQEATRKLKKSLIIQILLKLQNLKHEELNEQLKELLLSTNRRFCANLYGYYHKGIMTLLRYWGDAETIMGEYMKDNDLIEENDRREQAERDHAAKEEKERKIKEEKQQMALRRYADEMNRLRASIDNGNIISGDEERRLLLWEEKGEADFQWDNENGVRDSMALMLYNGSSRLNAATMRNQKAMQQIDKIFRSKIEQEEQKKLEDERQKLVSQRKKQKLKEVIDKRKLELGVGPKTEEGPGKDKLIYNDGEVEQEHEKIKKMMGRMMIPEIKLLNLDEEEDRDREAMNLVMKKYAKLWKNLYYKYCNSGFSSKNVSNFDQLNERSQTISLGEMSKLLRDHNAFPNLINKDELQTLFRLINTRLFRRQDLQALDYPAYQSFMLQLAYFCFTKEPRDLSHMPMVETVNSLIKHFEDATRARGHSTVLYEDPDATSVSDAKLIKALNEKLRQDPQYPIPEGYMKQMERTPIYDYSIPKPIASQMKESKVVATELLDWLLNEKFGFHVLEAQVKYEERLKVKPQIKNPLTNLQQGSTQAEALNYMKRVDKKARPSDTQNTLNPYASMSALEKLKLQQEVKPEVSLALKLEVAKVPIKDRSHAQDVAEVFEEILQAAEKGLQKLPSRLNRAPGQVWNEAKQKKEDDMKSQKDVLLRQEDKRKQRDEQLKKELVKLKEIKEKDEEEKKIKDKQDTEKKKEAARKADEALKSKIASFRFMTKDEAQIKQQEEGKKRREDIEKKAIAPATVESEKSKTERKAFMRKQKERMSQQFKQIIQEREDLAKKQEVVQQKEKELQQKVKQNMEAHIKEIAPDRGKEQRERAQINEFMNQEEVLSIFYRYEPALRQMFKFYASQDKKDVGFNLEKAMNSMNQRELIRFAYQQLIIPSLLLPEDIVQIFRQIIKERQEDVQSQIHDLEDNYLVDQNFAQIIDFEQFKKALVRIATLAASDNHAGGINSKLDSETANKKSNKKGAGKDFKISEEAKAKEEAFMEKIQASPQKKVAIASQRSRSSMKGPAKAATHQPAQSVDITPQKATQGPMLNALTNSLRMSKEVKILRALEEKEHLSNSIIAAASVFEKDRKVRKEFNVGLIQAKTIEALLRFLELEPEEKPQLLEAKLNQHRIEIQGQKPTRIKKQLKNTKLEDYIQELPHEENMQNTLHRQQSPSQLEDGEVLQQPNSPRVPQ